MPIKDAMLAVLVAVIWGMNFVVIDTGLAGVPPLLFVALRFVAVLFPAVFVIPRPAVPWRTLAAVGLLLSAGQFGFLYSALAVGLPPGLASLVVQAQVIFTVVLAAISLDERPTRRQVLGVAIGVLGLVVVAAGRSAQVPLLGLLLGLGGAMSWATGNIASRRAAVASGLSLTVWSALFVPIPLFTLALLVDGPGQIGTALLHLTAVNLLSTAYTAFLASLVGYGIWNTLLARHPAALVVPFTLLVPPIGMLTAWIAQGERPGAAEAIGGVVLLAGVAVTAFGRDRGTPAPPPVPAAEGTGSADPTSPPLSRTPGPPTQTPGRNRNPTRTPAHGDTEDGEVSFSAGGVRPGSETGRQVRPPEEESFRTPLLSIPPTKHCWSTHSWRRRVRAAARHHRHHLRLVSSLR